ncbi:hypothetical protein QTP81_06700 [Alteromonas sp. ASW11-36]|uniref:Universal stress protein B n=1 Tax=Alteromonas arenosi TaxID=3055817 RepID=A0ABT7SXL0_9ALTE|nr:hypothetical protein [Alteromonas sp. ASW11-36]MDM7860279.1 hypothetical protein [Alteromonas sp. ASW11-36]
MIVLVVLFVLNLLCVVMAFANHNRFLAHLKRNYPDLYQSLGRPKTFTRYTMNERYVNRHDEEAEQALRYNTFMANKEWRTLNDNVLNRSAVNRRTGHVIAFAIFMLLVVASLVANRV